MAIAYNDFVSDARFAPFGDTSLYPQDVVEAYLEGVLDDVPEVDWCSKRDRASKLLLAHRLTRWATSLADGGKATGEISSISVSQGSQSISFASSGQTSDPERFNSTLWGQEYMLLLKYRRCSAQTGFVL